MKIDVKLVTAKKDYLKCVSKQSDMLHKIFDNDLVSIGKSKVTLNLNKHACIGMCILELSKVPMYKFHCDYIKNKYDRKSKLLFTDIDSLMYENKTEDVYEDLNNDKEIFDFSNYWTKSKCYNNSHKLTIEKMKDETNAGVATAVLVGLKSKIYPFLIGHNSEHKKSKRRE